MRTTSSTAASTTRGRSDRPVRVVISSQPTALNFPAQPDGAINAQGSRPNQAVSSATRTLGRLAAQYEATSGGATAQTPSHAAVSRPATFSGRTCSRVLTLDLTSDALGTPTASASSPTAKHRIRTATAYTWRRRTVAGHGATADAGPALPAAGARQHVRQRLHRARTDIYRFKSRPRTAELRRLPACPRYRIDQYALSDWQVTCGSRPRPAPRWPWPYGAPAEAQDRKLLRRVRSRTGPGMRLAGIRRPGQRADYSYALMSRRLRGHLRQTDPSTRWT